MSGGTWLFAAALAVVQPAVGSGVSPRNEVEALVWSDPAGAQVAMRAWVERHRADADRGAAHLLAAGFTREPDALGCSYYGYHRTIDPAGNGRMAQIAFCPGEPLVLVAPLIPRNAFGNRLPSARKSRP